MRDILVVDDDATVLHLTRRALCDRYRVSVARDGDEALAMAQRMGSLDLVITDYLMPSMQGDELLGRLRESRPALKAIVLTGHGAILARDNPSWWGAEAFLDKPFEIDVLQNAVDYLIGPGESAKITP